MEIDNNRNSGTYEKLHSNINSNTNNKINSNVSQINLIQVKDYVTKSSLPSSDFVINPYVGCPHGCKYCYASFMKRFTGHKEAWGTFVDVKMCAKPISRKRLCGKSVFLSSVTDCYNPYEEQYGITRQILTQLAEIDCSVTITTKSDLILRNIALLQRFPHLTVAVSINTADENFKNDMDRASSIADRLHVLKTLHEHGIRTVLFLSPIFPGITDFREIVELSAAFTEEYWFENLNLRGNYKHVILSYISEKYPHLTELYHEIYQKGNLRYWEEQAAEIEAYCGEHAVRHQNYFYHEKLVRETRRGPSGETPASGFRSEGGW